MVCSFHTQHHGNLKSFWRWWLISNKQPSKTNARTLFSKNSMTTNLSEKTTWTEHNLKDQQLHPKSFLFAAFQNKMTNRMAKCWQFCRAMQQSHHGGFYHRHGTEPAAGWLTSCDGFAIHAVLVQLLVGQEDSQALHGHAGLEDNININITIADRSTTMGAEMSTQDYTKTGKSKQARNTKWATVNTDTILEMTDAVIIIITGMVDGGDDSLRWSEEPVAITSCLYQTRWLSSRTFLVLKKTTIFRFSFPLFLACLEATAQERHPNKN